MQPHSIYTTQALTKAWCPQQMTRHQVKEFFKDNFGKGYHPVLHGRCETITPLALIAKQKKKWYRRANLVAVANLAKYVVDEHRPAHRKLARGKIKKIKKKLAKDEVERLEVSEGNKEIRRREKCSYR